MNDHAQLLEQFVASFEKFDDMTAIEGLSPVAWQLSAGQADEYGRRSWRPVKASSSRAVLDRLYSKFPLRFPSLFESFLLSYRWEEVELDSYRLMANPPGPDLSGFYSTISRDSGVWDALVAKGYLRFGRGRDADHDPICFDTKSRDKFGDCRVVKVDHQQILNHQRVRIVHQLASGFKDLVLQTINKAQSL